MQAKPYHLPEDITTRKKDWLYSYDNSNSTFSVGPLLLSQITTA